MMTISYIIFEDLDCQSTWRYELKHLHLELNNTPTE